MILPTSTYARTFSLGAVSWMVKVLGRTSKLAVEVFKMAISALKYFPVSSIETETVVAAAPTIFGRTLQSFRTWCLIDRSRVVICDCTKRNPNVFYEIGIAYTLGRDVILITQNDADVP